MSRLPHVLIGLYIAVCALAVVWPGFAWVSAHVEGTVLGLPFPLFWAAAWAALTCVALGLYHLKVGERDA